MKGVKYKNGWLCKYCSGKFKDKKQAEEHVKECLKKADEMDFLEKMKLEEEVYSPSFFESGEIFYECIYCNEKFETKEEAIWHLKNCRLREDCLTGKKEIYYTGIIPCKCFQICGYQYHYVVILPKDYKPKGFMLLRKIILDNETGKVYEV